MRYSRSRQTDRQLYTKSYAIPTEWPKVNFIIGNPPFLGGKRLRAELDDNYINMLFNVYNGRVARESDLVCYFFEKARAQIEKNDADRAGLLATNSIRGGANREALKRIKQTGDIYMAWSDEPWILNGAAVRISIVGFDDGTEANMTLNGLTVSNINSDLTATIDITSASRLKENLGISFMGITPAGPFDIDGTLAREMLSLPVNPNGHVNADVIRPYFNGKDLTRRPAYRWIIDFGTSMSEEESALYEAPYQYALRVVKPVRMENRSTTGIWWRHERPRAEMRAVLAQRARYLATSMVSKHRFYSWLETNVLPANLLIVFGRDDDYFFGVLHSRIHEVWSLRMGTSLEDRPRYTPTTCFETFPLPWPPGQEPVDDPRVIAIGEAAKRLDELRNNWLNPESASDADLKKRTLTNLYNAKPTWLQNAHAALDRAVWNTYGWPEDEVPAEVEEDVILSRLLALNGERATP